MSYTFLLESGAESSAECYEEIPAYALSSLTCIAGEYCFNASGTAFCLGSQSGMTLNHSTDDVGAGESMSFAVGSRARILAQRASELGWGGQGVVCGRNNLEWFAKLDPLTLKWKTPQPFVFGDSEPSLETWPAWGMMLNGACFPLPMLAHDTSVKGHGLKHPTPTARSARGSSGRMTNQSHFENWLRHEFSQREGTTYPHPELLEAVMGFPIGWSAVEPLEIAKFQRWSDLHMKYYHE